MTFVATTNAILYAGGIPVFADIESLERPLVSVREVERLLTPKTKAIVVMHYGGYPYMDEILVLAKQRGIPVVEDAAHAIGSRYKGKPCGTIGAAGAFSFFANKNLPAGEGGAVVTSDAKLFEEMRNRRSHGMTTLSWDRFKGHSFSDHVVALGYNYRMPELTSAVATVQLAKLDAHNVERGKAVAAYFEALRGTPGLVVPFVAEAEPGARHLMPVILPAGVDCVGFMDRLKAEGIQSSIHYPPVHQFSHYRAIQGAHPVSLPVTEEYARRVVTLPLHPKLKASDVAIIARVVRQALTRATTCRARASVAPAAVG